MDCKNCGNEIDKRAVVCPNCGCKVKKRIFKKWWFWVIICIFVIAIGSSAGGNDNSNNNSETSNSSQTSSVASEASKKSNSSQTSSIESKVSKKITKEEYIELCDTIDFETLSRNPDKYKGKKYELTGEIIQVQELSYSDTVTLRINITKETYEY